MPAPSSAPRPAESMPALPCTVAAIETATPAIRIVHLKLPEGSDFTHRAGQYARLGFGGFEVRDYSIASAPEASAPGANVVGDRTLTFHIRDMGGDGPSAYAARHLCVGETVDLYGPFGDAYLRPEKPGPILALCGGSGLAPMTAIVEAALAQGLTQPIDLYFGARREGDIYREERFARLAAAHPNLTFTPVLSDAEGPTSRRQGLITDAVAADFNSLAGRVAYLAGPPPMVEAGVRLCRDLGIAEADIHADPQ